MSRAGLALCLLVGIPAAPSAPAPAACDSRATFTDGPANSPPSADFRLQFDDRAPPSSSSSSSSPADGEGACRAGADAGNSSHGGTTDGCSDGAVLPHGITWWESTIAPAGPAYAPWSMRKESGQGGGDREQTYLITLTAALGDVAGAGLEGGGRVKELEREACALFGRVYAASGGLREDGMGRCCYEDETLHSVSARSGAARITPHAHTQTHTQTHTNTHTHSHTRTHTQVPVP